jgi:hypothetical protein
MTDEEYRQEVERRWQESMALLGLASTPPPKKKAEPQPQPAPQSPPAEVVQEFEDELDREAQDWTKAAAAQIAKDTEPAAEEVQSTAGETEETVAEKPLEDEDEDPATGRRRGRRGRGSRGKKPEPAADAAAVTSAEGAAEASKAEKPEEERPGRRGRGRPRARTEKPARAAPGRQAETSAPAKSDSQQAEVEGEADDDTSDLSEWDVPSWQDLIASLYRPDRDR